mgnify:CR=1 FL=1
MTVDRKAGASQRGCTQRRAVHPRARIGKARTIARGHFVIGHEVMAERDRLRAEYAMLSQRLGARLEATKLQMAEHMADVSRHRNRLHELEALEANRGADNRRLAERVVELEFELAQARAMASGTVEGTGAWRRRWGVGTSHHQ